MRKSLYLLGILNDSDLDWMIANGRRERIARGTVLIEEGKAIDTIYIVLEGRFSVTIAADKGAEIARLFSGEVTGEMSFVDSRPPSATVTALEDGLVLALSQARLAAKLDQDVAFASRFYRALSVFLADRMRSTVSRLGYHSTASLDEEAEYEDELDPNVLDNMALAGARFDWMLKRIRGD